MLSARGAFAAAPELEAPPSETCPRAEDLRRAISSQLGRDDFDRVDAPRVAVRVRRTESASLVADVTLATSRAAPTTRVIDGGGGTCAELVRAAALSIALAIEAEVPPPIAPEPPLPAPPAPPPLPPPSLEQGAALMARELRDARVLLLASGQTQLGLLPSASLGAGGAARVRVTDRAWVSARGFFLPEARMGNDAFGMTLAGGGAGMCIEPFGARNVTALGCAHVLAGSLAVVSRNAPMANGGMKPFGAGALAAGARARVLGPVVVEGAVEATVPFAHPTFLTATCPSVGFQQPFAALALVFAAGVSIP